MPRFSHVSAAAAPGLWGYPPVVDPYLVHLKYSQTCVPSTLNMQHLVSRNDVNKPMANPVWPMNTRVMTIIAAAIILVKRSLDV